jgi:hypothetical protein
MTLTVRPPKLKGVNTRQGKDFALAAHSDEGAGGAHLIEEHRGRSAQGGVAIVEIPRCGYGGRVGPVIVLVAEVEGRGGGAALFGVGQRGLFGMPYLALGGSGDPVEQLIMIGEPADVPQAQAPGRAGNGVQFLIPLQLPMGSHLAEVGEGRSVVPGAVAVPVVHVLEVEAVIGFGGGRDGGRAGQSAQ